MRDTCNGLQFLQFFYTNSSSYGEQSRYSNHQEPTLLPPHPPHPHPHPPTPPPPPPPHPPPPHPPPPHPPPPPPPPPPPHTHTHTDTQNKFADLIQINVSLESSMHSILHQFLRRHVPIKVRQMPLSTHSKPYAKQWQHHLVGWDYCQLTPQLEISILNFESVIEHFATEVKNFPDITYCIIVLCVRQHLSYCLHL